MMKSKHSRRFSLEADSQLNAPLNIARLVTTSILMSGRKQHFIPQSFLRGFATPRQNNVFVTVYPKERPIFEVPTDGIAAQRDFYSALGVDGSEPTLDDHITTFEGGLAVTIRALRELAPGMPVDRRAAAGLVTHLTMRNAHFRNAATFGAGKMFETVKEVFTDRDRTRAALQLDTDTLSGPMLEQFNEQWAQAGPMLETLGITRTAFAELIRTRAGPLFEQMFGEIAQGIESAIATIAPQVAETGANAQKRALTQDLVPPVRVEKIVDFSWTRRPAPPGGVILPDCVAIGYEGDKWLPLSIADLDEVDIIAMPLDAATILWAGKAGTADVPADFNASCAACSWDFFLAASRSDALEGLIPVIRTETERFFDDVMREALSES
jgi:hypothetical protein